jgi:hypothetical protein
LARRKCAKSIALFDFEHTTYLPEQVARYLAVASHGQAIMVRFFLGVWRHADEFDFIDAAETLDEQQMKVITDWLQDPLWP